MPNIADDGFGATLTFGTSGTSLQILTIQEAGLSRASLDSTHHGTTGGYKTFNPADLKDPGNLTATFFYNGNVQPPVTTAETITLTYPVPSGKATGATAASSGFVESWDGPDVSMDANMIGTLTIKRSGVVTYTTAST